MLVQFASRKLKIRFGAKYSSLSDHREICAAADAIVIALHVRRGPDDAIPHYDRRLAGDFILSSGIIG